MKQDFIQIIVIITVMRYNFIVVVVEMKYY